MHLKDMPLGSSKRIAGRLNKIASDLAAAVRDSLCAPEMQAMDILEGTAGNYGLKMPAPAI
jgi:hypothetical protein